MVETVAWLTVSARYGSGLAGAREGGPSCQLTISNTAREKAMRGLSVLFLLLMEGCPAGGDDARRPSARERDSVIGASRLPGAAGVRGALRVADSAAARNTRLDSVNH